MKWAAKVHEIVINEYYCTHYTKNAQGSRLSQKMGAESDDVTPSVKHSLIRGKNLTLIYIFRSTSLPMTGQSGKTAGLRSLHPAGCHL